MEPRLRDNFMNRLKNDPKIGDDDIKYYHKAMDIIDKYVYEEQPQPYQHNKQLYQSQKSANARSVGKRPKTAATAIWTQPTQQSLQKKPAHYMSIREKNMADKKFDFKQKTF